MDTFAVVILIIALFVWTVVLPTIGLLHVIGLT